MKLKRLKCLSAHVAIKPSLSAIDHALANLTSQTS